MLRLILGLIFFATLSPVQAATTLDPLRITFTAEKVSHTCTPLVGGAPVPGDDCGFYSSLDFGVEYLGFVEFESYINQNDGSYLLTDDQYSCTVGLVNCRYGSAIFSSGNVVGPTSFNFVGFGSGSFGGSFSFNFITGTGGHSYEDDVFPLFSRVSLSFSNVMLVAPQVVPVPASALLLVSGLFLAAGATRSKRKTSARKLAF